MQWLKKKLFQNNLNHKKKYCSMKIILTRIQILAKIINHRHPHPNPIQMEMKNNLIQNQNKVIQYLNKNQNPNKIQNLNKI